MLIHTTRKQHSFIHTNECFGESACGIVKESKSAILGVHRDVRLCVVHSMHGRYCRPRCRIRERKLCIILPSFPMDAGRTRELCSCVELFIT